jgi:HAD superfamily hydrolase (TIGR01662 family)
MSKVNLVVGPPASGKTSITKDMFASYARLNRDEMGGSVAGLLPKLAALLFDGKDVVLDNLFTTAADRKPFITLAKQHGAVISCTEILLDIETCMVNACVRMMKNHGKILTPEEIKKSKNPNDIPPVILFKFRKNYEPPSVAEGFDSVDVVKGYSHTFTGTNKALILDYDGTIRETVGGNGKFPVEPGQIKILPGRAKRLAEYKSMGYLLLGVSNQSGIAKGDLTDEQAKACFDATNKFLGLDIEYQYCPHRIPPVSCFCRKPQTGAGIYFIEKYKLDLSKCLMVGDLTSDKTFSNRLGIPYMSAERFFV